MGSKSNIDIEHDFYKAITARKLLSPLYILTKLNHIPNFRDTLLLLRV
jgi:hypothetical protein